MSLTKFESEVKFIPQTQQVVYDRFADLNNLAFLKERLSDPAVQDELARQVPADKVADLRSYAEKMEFTADSITIESPLGQITLRIIEREEPKCIKFNLEGAPIQANLWIQLLERDTETLLKCTLGTELNFLLRQMVGNKIQDAANQLATTLAAIPY